MKIKIVFAILIWAFFSSVSLAQNAQEYYKTGYIYFSQGNYQKALGAYQQAIELDPQFWEAHYWLGKVQEKLGNIPEAVAAWRRVLIAQPLHKDAFQKWRYYASYIRVSQEERERLKDAFLFRDTAPSIGKEEAWSRVIPYALSLMGEKDLISLRLAGAIMRWAGRNVSALLAPYERFSYKRALEILKEDFSKEDSYAVYEFLRECLLRFEEDREIRNLVNENLELIFAAEAQVSPEEGTQTLGIEFRTYQDRVEKEILTSFEGSSGPRIEFYLKEHGAEGGS